MSTPGAGQILRLIDNPGLDLQLLVVLSLISKGITSGCFFTPLGEGPVAYGVIFPKLVSTRSA